MNYEYGKEYPCSGHKPGLEGDVVVEVKTKRFNFGELSAAKVSLIKWGSVLGFRIVDERYKPKPEDNTWFERGELPPVGIECEYKFKNTAYSWTEVVVNYISKQNAILIIKNGGKEVHADAFKAEDFRLIRTEREKAIEAAKDALLKTGSMAITANLETLYDAGLLRLPEKK